MQFYFLISVSLLTGIVLASLATWLSTKRGNTISEIIAANEHLPANQALEMAVMDKFKLATGIPVVGLYVVAALCALALPAFFMYLTHLGPQFDIAATFDDHPTKLQVAEAAKWQADGDGFDITVPAIAPIQYVRIDPGNGFGPLTLSFEVTRTRQVYYWVNGRAQHGPLDIDANGTLHIGTLHLTRVPNIAVTTNQ
jgi:hypothetical protein